MTLQPGQSISREDCKLLERGDYVLSLKEVGGYRRHGHAVTVEPPATLSAGVNQVWYRADNGQIAFGPPETFTFLGRPGADGFIPWTGGENPLPGKMVYAKLRDGHFDRDGRPVPSDKLIWDHSPAVRSIHVIGWRPAPSVEDGGSLRAEDRPFVPSQREDGPADQWLEAEGSDGRSTLLYTLRQDGWRKSQPIMVNDMMVRIEAAPGSDADWRAARDIILAALSAADRGEGGK